MSLRMALLGLLASRGPGSGYDLAKIFSGTLTQVWSAGHSQIYPELARMTTEGLVTVQPEGSRGRKIYEVTRQGRETLVEWLTDVEPSRTVRSESALRAFLLPVVAPEEAIELVRREAALYRERAEKLKSLDDAGPGRRFGHFAAELGFRQSTALAEWAEWAAAELEQDRVAAVDAAASANERGAPR